MKALLVLLAFVAAPAFAETALICRSYDKVDGWNATTTYDYIHFTAYAQSNTELTKSEVNGAYSSDMRDLKADPKYKPSNARYKDYNRFGVLEDAWHWFQPLLPKDYLERQGSFRGYMQIIGEEGYVGTVAMKCFLK